jgi:hypothetical protein
MHQLAPDFFLLCPQFHQLTPGFFLLWPYLLKLLILSHKLIKVPALLLIITVNSLAVQSGTGYLPKTGTHIIHRTTYLSRQPPPGSFLPANPYLPP